MKTARTLRATAVTGAFVLGSYSGCTPDLDKLSSEYGFGGAPSGGTTSSEGGALASSGSGGTHPNPAGGAAGNSGAGAGEAGAPMVGAGGKGSGGTTSTAAGGTVTSSTAGASGSSGAGQGGQGGEAGQGPVMCPTGYATCPGAAECATALATGNPSGNTVDDCGACGTTCSVVNATASACTAGSCRATCKTGFADCNTPAANDGCEADLKSPAHCGACAHACSNAGTTSLSCTNSLCMPTCAPAHADCNVDDGTRPDDGCEVYLDALNHCGTSCTQFETCPKSKVCNAGSCVPAQGIVAFSVPLAAATDNQRYADKFSPYPNLTNDVITLRLYAPGATGGSVNIYFSDADFSGGNGTIVPLNTLSQGWTDISVAVGGITGSFDPSIVSQVNLEVNGSGGTSFTNPTIMYVDGIRTSNGLVNDRFDAALGNMVKSSLQMVAGSTLTWIDAVP
jgi:hypothetical protein